MEKRIKEGWREEVNDGGREDEKRRESQNKRRGFAKRDCSGNQCNINIYRYTFKAKEMRARETTHLK